MVGRPHSRENGWGGVVVAVPTVSPPMERLSCVPSCREEKERLSAEWESREGSLRTWVGELERSCGLLQTGLPPTLSLAFPATPDTARALGSFLWQQPKPLDRLASPPTSSWGTRDHGGGNRALQGSEQSWDGHYSNGGVY